jgi:hypothetical protein
MGSMIARIEQTDLRLQDTRVPIYVSRKLVSSSELNYPGTTAVLGFSSTLR